MVSPLLKEYFNRMKGQRYQPKKYIDGPITPSRPVVLFFSFLGAFAGISSVAAINYYAQFFVERNFPVIAGSFGASAVLIYGAIDSPLSQPRNFFGGHIISALIGVSLYKLFNMLSEETFHKLNWLLCSLSVAVSLTVMQLTHTVHPPASATALIAVTGGQTIYDQGYWFVLCPILLGVSVMFTIALIINNIARKYPLFWWNPKQRKIIVVDQDMSAPIADFVSSEDDDENNLKHEKTRDDDTATGNGSKVSSSSSSNSDLNSTVYNKLSTSYNSPSLTQHSIAVYYGGERNEELKNGDVMFQDVNSIRSNPDLEIGNDHHHRPSIRLEVPSSSPQPSSAPSSLHKDEDHQLVIRKLQQRIHELEGQLAAANSK